MSTPSTGLTGSSGPSIGGPETLEQPLGSGTIALSAGASGTTGTLAGVAEKN